MNDECLSLPLEDLRNLLEEIRPLDFLICGTPGNVVGEHVREDSLAQWNGQATEEEEAGGWRGRLITWSKARQLCTLTRTEPI